MRYPDRPPARLASTSWQTRGPRSAATRRASWAPRGRGGRWPTWSPRSWSASRSWCCSSAWPGSSAASSAAGSGWCRTGRRPGSPGASAGARAAGCRSRGPRSATPSSSPSCCGPLDFLLVAFAVSLPVLLLLAPWLSSVDDHEHGRLADRPGRRGLARRARSGRSRWYAVAYVVTLAAAAQAALARLLLDPREAQLVADRCRAAPLAGGPGRRLRDRAASDRARPARRRPAAAGRPHHDAGPGGARRARTAPGWSPSRTPTGRPRRRWPSCAAPSAASTPGAGRPRPGRRGARAGGPLVGAHDRRHPAARPAAAAGRAGGVLRRERGAHQRGPPLRRAAGRRACLAPRRRPSCSRSRTTGWGAPPPTASAPGWPGWRVRLEALGGTLQVTSPPGGPTEMRMECPV